MRDAVVSRGGNTVTEPTISALAKVKLPDLVAFRSQKAMIIDTTICADANAVEEKVIIIIIMILSHG